MPSNKPLAGVCVLDLSNVLAGPFCCQQLAQLGARVIKVEHPEQGDLARSLGADPELSAQGMGVSFLAQNAGKESIALNLKSPEGRAVLLKLVARAQVLVENFRPQVMERLQLGYRDLRRVNPRLVYCAISGFGQDGELAQRPAYDQIIQGLSGAMAITGDENSAPLRVGYPIADTIGGLTAGLAICAALNAPEPGTYIDVSMLEATMATMGWAVSNWLIAGVAARAQGNDNFTAAPSGSFRCVDSLLNIAANQERQWRILVEELQRPELLQRPEFADREARKRNRKQLQVELETTLQTQTAAYWEQRLNQAGVPAGRVLSLEQALAQAQIQQRGLIQHFQPEIEPEREISVLGSAARFDGAATAVDTPPPRLGADSDAIMQELGYSQQAIEQLRADQVIR